MNHCTLQSLLSTECLPGRQLCGMIVWLLKPLLNKLGSLRAIFYLHLQYSLIHQVIIGHLGHGILSYLYCGILTVRKYSLWGKKSLRRTIIKHVNPTKILTS